MAFKRNFMVMSLFVLAALGALSAAWYSVQLIEDRSEIDIRTALDQRGLVWAEVEADGLQVTLAGEAPTEALRFTALSVAGSVVDAARVIDEIAVTPVAALAAPRFSAELLRNTSGISIIGLLPASSDRAAIISSISELDGLPVTDLLESADYPAPRGWEDALAFAIGAIRDLPRAKVSVDAGRVEVTAIADSEQQKTDMENTLRRRAPPALRLSLNITAPRPVVSPFTLRFVKDAEGARFDACSADSAEALARISDAATNAGFEGTPRCTIAMGVPTPYWSEGVEKALSTLASIGGGSVTFQDAEVTLMAAPGTEAAIFDRAIGELEAVLPDVFVLNAVLPPSGDSATEPAEFLATLSPEGQVQLRGRLSGEDMRVVADTFARAKFGSDKVYTAARVVPDLPPDWSARVLTGIEALSLLHSGAVTVTADQITLSGRSGDPDASDKITRLMVEKLGEQQSFDIGVDYLEILDPVASLPTPEECETRIAEIIARRKITFEPGSATIDEGALGTMDAIAEVLSDCGDLRLEVQGYTDSQGREEMNLALSQSRAESVLNELRARRVLTSGFLAKGYGEANPVADNGTEEGREANRRIEFRLISPKPSIPQGESALESLAETGNTEAGDE